MIVTQQASAAIEIVDLDDVTYSARVVGGKVLDLVAERQSESLVEGSVLVGRVTKSGSNGKAALIDIGQRAGVPLFRVRDLQEGSLVAVQLLSGSQSMEDGKQPPVSLDVALPARHLVHRPFGDGISFSKRLPKSDHPSWSDRLASLHNGGWIVRASALGQPGEAVLAEGERLSHLAMDVLQPLENRQPGDMLHSGPRAWQRMIIDEPNPVRIRTGSLDARQRLTAWLKVTCSELLETVDSAMPTALLGLIDDIERLFHTALALPGGGSLWIEKTRALTAVDVDAPLDAQRVSVNRTAARILGEQIRLRNLGGLFAVDFLRMSKTSDRRHVIETLKTSLQNNATGGAASLHFAPEISPIGPYLFSRQRRGSALADVVDNLDD